MNELKLLHALESNARLKVADLADILMEKEADVRKTKEQLEADKVICGYHTVINWDKTSDERVSAIIEVSAKPEREHGYDKVAESIAKYPEVSSLYLISGKSEFMVFVDGKTMKQVADFVAQKLAPIEGVTATVTSFILKPYKVEGVDLVLEKKEDDRLIVTP
ncbi:MAG: Lrp/AsnC family transcriptional regulator [Erysipelotrichaceae bacterium]|nr:Lrp/AsnC family transcriptional regulator [Erysipelotrichaceae bacterium]